MILLEGERESNVAMWEERVDVNAVVVLSAQVSKPCKRLRVKCVALYLQLRKDTIERGAGAGGDGQDYPYRLAAQC